MLDDALTIHANTIRLLTLIVADMSDDELAKPIAPGHHSGTWVLGHLSVALDLCRRRLGNTVDISDERMKAFGPGSDPAAAPPAGSTKEHLIGELRKRHDLVAAAIAEADPEMLARPHGLPWFADTPLKTMADVVRNLLTAHNAFHVGQLSTYRRALGRPPLF